jgi:hypothetical protein
VPFQKAKKNKYSAYDLQALLAALAKRLTMTVWREEGFGETDFSPAGGPEDWKRVRRVTVEILQKAANKEPTLVIVEFTVKELFPKVKIRQLIAAIKQDALSYQNYEDRMICSTIETILPEYIEYFSGVYTATETE